MACFHHCDAEKGGLHVNKAIATVFADCVYNQTELISFLVGMSSLGFWLCCQAPQFIKNIRVGSVKALSLWFLLEWFGGDFLNLLGAFLSGQHATQIITACLFIFMDICMLSQVLYYNRKNKHHHQTSKHNKKPSRPNKNNNNNDDSGDSLDSATPRQLPALVPITDMSPTISCTTATTSTNRSSRPRTSSEPFAFVPAQNSRSSTMLGKNSTTVGNTAVAVAATTALLAMPGVVEAVALLVDDPTQSCEQTIGKFRKQFGWWLGWVSTAVYLNSRLPQILKNKRERCTEGLSKMMFICAVCGNLTYSLGVMLRIRSWSEYESALPWLVGSLGTMSLDFVIISQVMIYKRARKYSVNALLRTSTTSYNTIDASPHVSCPSHGISVSTFEPKIVHAILDPHLRLGFVEPPYLLPDMRRTNSF